MADEVEEPADTQFESFVKEHLKMIGEISQQGYEKSVALCDESLVGIQQKSGLKSALLDKALETLGIKKPVNE